MSDFPTSDTGHWETRGTAAALLFVGILMSGGGFLAAIVVAIASMPLAMLNFTWPWISGASTLIFLSGLARICGWHLLP